MKLLIAASLLLLTLPTAPAETRWEKSARARQTIAAQITWPDHEPLQFVLRRGDHEEDVVDRYRQMHDPANIRRMAELGTQIERLHFYKGFGLVTEVAEMAQTREMAERMHALGMKVSVYVAGTMFVETFYREVPEAVHWEERDQDNRPVPYMGAQTYRHFACRNEPAYLNYLERVLRVAVKDVKADEIFFDNIFEQPEPKSCRCPRCLAAFREFLRRRYPTPAACIRRFGYPSPDYVQVSEWDEYNRPDQLQHIDDPVLQEWTLFRAETLARYCATLYDYVKSLNPKVAVGFNLKGIYGTNRIWRNAVYHPFFRGKIDFSPFDAAGFDAHIDRNTGALISSIRSYKMARTLGFSYQTGGDPLEFAVYMAFNPQKEVPGFGPEGGPWTYDAGRVFTPEAEFFRHYNARYFTGTHNVADVAVLRTWPSMAYSITATRVPTVLMEQVLIQHQVPFDLIFDADQDQIGKYQAVILPGQESLSQAWVDALLAYARGGGTVVFTGNTADFNDRRERRRVNPLRALLPGNARGIASATLGRGRLVFIPSIDARPAAASRVEDPGADEANVIANGTHQGDLAPSDWVLPANHVAIFHAIADHVARGLSLRTTAPDTVVMELLDRPGSNETLVHAVNFDSAHPTKPYVLKLATRGHGRAQSVQLFSPDADEPVALPFTEGAEGVTVTVPSLRLYDMVVIRW